MYVKIRHLAPWIFSGGTRGGIRGGIRGDIRCTRGGTRDGTSGGPQVVPKWSTIDLSLGIIFDILSASAPVFF